MRDIVVGVDGSEVSRRALDRALRLARLQGRTTRVVHAWQPPQPLTNVLGPGYKVDTAQARDDAMRTASQLLEDEIAGGIDRADSQVGPVLGVLREGAPPTVLAKAAEDAAVVVLGTRSHGRVTALLGTAVPHVLHRAGCPVLVVPQGSDAAQPFGHVVVGFDGSPSSQAALRWALDIAAEDRTCLVVVRATEDRRLPSPWVNRSRGSVADLRAEVLACDPRAARLDVDYRVVDGRADAVLPSTVGRDDLLVVGSRGLGGFAGMLLGSVSAYCVSNPLAAVAVVRADAELLDDVTDGAKRSSSQEV